MHHLSVHWQSHNSWELSWILWIFFPSEWHKHLSALNLQTCPWCDCLWCWIRQHLFHQSAWQFGKRPDLFTPVLARYDPYIPLADVAKWTPVFCFILVKLRTWIKPSFFVVLARVNYGVMRRDKPACCNCTELVFPFNVVGFMLLCLVQGITHVTHFFLPVSIPIFHIFSFFCGLFLINRKMQSPVSARNTGTQRLGCLIQTRVCEAQFHRGADPSSGLRRGCFYMHSR